MTPARRQPRTRPRSARRAFALVLVVMLTFIVGLGIAILFQRHGVASLASRRHADDYTTRHAGLGMREMVSRWLTTVRGKLVESLDEDGFAFTLDFTDGQRVDVFMEDAQGAALSDASALTGRRREIVELMNYYLAFMPEEQRQGLVRRHGPSEISIAAAKPEVLLALAQAIVGPDNAEDVAEAIAERRDERFDLRSSSAGRGAGAGGGGSGKGGMRETIAASGGGGGGGGSLSRSVSIDQIVRVLSELQVEPAKIAEFQAMFVASPTLWFATAELRGEGGKVVDRAGGLIEINAARSDPFNQNGPFITWETLPLEEDSETPSGR